MGRPLLEHFARKGEQEKFRVWLTPKKKKMKGKTKEYMIDLCWDVESKGGNWLELAMESELSSQAFDEIIDDFEKLTDVKALTKVFICNPTIKRSDKVLSRCQQLISSHRIRQNPKDQYLVITINGKSISKRQYHSIVSGYLFDSNGHRKNLRTKEFLWD